MAHRELVESGLAKLYGVSPVTNDMTLAPFLGKTVRYKRKLLTREFLRRNGTIARDCTFLIREVQKNYRGDSVLRGYAVEWGDTFGRPIDPVEIEII